MISSGKDGKDLKSLNEMLRNRFGAKGGGNQAMIQGSLSDAVITDVIDSCKDMASGQA